MKRCFWLALICVLLLGAAMAETDMIAEPGIFTEEEAAPYIGEWYLSSITSEGTAFSPESMGFLGHLMLYGDGTGKMIIGTSIIEQVWYKTDDGIVLGEGKGDDLPMYIQENGDLFTGDETASMIFTRRYAQDDPAIRQDVQMDDFTGDWVLTRIVKGKDTYLPEELNCEMRVTLNKNSFIAVTNGEKAEGEIAQTAYTMSNSRTRFVMHEDGTLSCEDNTFILWFEKA